MDNTELSSKAMHRSWLLLMGIAGVTGAGCAPRQVDADPVFTRIELEDVAEEAMPGDAIVATIYGTELWARTIVVEVHRVRSSDDEDEILATIEAQMDEDPVEQRTDVRWVVQGAFLGETERNSIYLRAVFQDAALDSTSFVVEVAPVLSTVALSGPARTGVVIPGDEVTIDASGRELSFATGVAEIVLDGAAEEVLATGELRFERDAASFTWTVPNRLGRSDLFVRVTVGDQILTSPIFVLDVQPRLVSVELVGLSSGSVVDVGTDVRIRARAEDLWSETLQVEVLVTATGGTEMTVQTLDLRLDGDRTSQAGEVTWRILGPFADERGRYDLRVRVTHGDDSVTSPLVVIDVVTAFTKLELLCTTRDGTHPCADREILRPEDDVALEVEGVLLVGEVVRFEVFRNQTVSIASEMTTATTNRLRFDFAPMIADLGTGDTSPIFVRVSAKNATATSMTVVYQLRGISDCSWRNALGVEYPDREEIDSGLLVTMHASTWGFMGVRGTMEIWESDSASDDFVARFDFTAGVESGERTWTTMFMEDGLLDTTAEYYFIVSLGSFTCESPFLEVKE